MLAVGLLPQCAAQSTCYHSCLNQTKYNFLSSYHPLRQELTAADREKTKTAEGQGLSAPPGEVTFCT